MRNHTLPFISLTGALLVAACAGAESLLPTDHVENSSPASVVQRQLDAYNNHDLQAFVATYSDDVVLYRVPATVPALTGKQQLSDFYRTSRFNLPHLRAELMYRTVVGNKVIDHERITGLREQAVEAVAAYVVREGSIESVWLFLPE